MKKNKKHYYYCSNECKKNHLSEGKIQIHCLNCSKDFVAKKSSKRKFCSKECYNNYLKINNPLKGIRKNSVIKTCKYCNKEFIVRKSRENTAFYCSRKCSDLSKIIDIPNATCIICGKKYHIKPYQIKRSLNNVCSKECNNKYRSLLMSGKNNHQYGLKGTLNKTFINDVTIKKNNKLYEHMVYYPTHKYANKAGRVCEHRLLVELNWEKFDIKYFDIIDGFHYLKKRNRCSSY